MASVAPLGRILSLSPPEAAAATPNQSNVADSQVAPVVHTEEVGDLTPPTPVNEHATPDVTRAERQPTDSQLALQPSDEHRPSTSISASSTAASGDQAEQTIREDRDRELGEPSEKGLRRAGMAATMAPLAGAGAARSVARSGDQEPRGWDGVDVGDKYSVWSSGVRDSRKAAIKKGAFLFGFITIWLWICLSIFWGSNYKLTTYFPNLGVHLVSFDTDPDSFLNGPMIRQAEYEAALPRSIVHLGWDVRDASDYPDGLADVEDNVLSQKAWVTVVINANATSAWRNALATGDASYDPTGAITIYYQSARFYQVTLLYFEQLLGQSLANPLSTARGQAYSSFLTSVQGDAGAIARAAQVPQAIGVGFGYNIHDLRSIPNGAWAGAAPMEAGLIYFVIFGFYIALFGGMARMKSSLANKLTFRSMMALRLGWPVLAYFFLSLWFTLVERAFQIPMWRFMGSGGFPALWALNWVTIIAAGFALETVLAIVGVSWLPFFLILWIILNITSSFYPIELMPRFYRFLYWTPFLHNVEGMKIIAYGTNLQHRLGKHFGIIFGLIGVELICLPLALFFERWSQDRSTMREVAEKDKEKE